MERSTQSDRVSIGASRTIGIFYRKHHVIYAMSSKLFEQSQYALVKQVPFITHKYINIAEQSYLCNPGFTLFSLTAAKLKSCS